MINVQKYDIFPTTRLNAEGYRVVHIKKNQEMWYEVYTEHRKRSPRCTGMLKWDMASEERRGMGCREAAVCSECGYKSRMHALYEEVDTGLRGRKSADLNMGIQVGLSLSPIGPTALRRLCLSSNLAAPSHASLQTTANKVNDQIVSENTKDMKRRRQRLKQINIMRGLKSPENIHVQSDGMYNNPLYSGVGKTPFQPATQMVYSVAENETKNHDIISLVTKNKLCSKHKHLDREQTCGPSCSANIPFDKSIGDEYSWAREAFEELAHDGLHVSHLCTDPDSSAYRAAEDLACKNNNKFMVQHYIDTRHLAENHRKSMKRDENLAKIVKGKTKAERVKTAHNLAIDIADRCQAEINRAYRIHTGDVHIMKKKLSYVQDAIMQCYQGCHDLCKKKSFVCKGGKRNNWILKSAFLSNNESFALVKGKKTNEILSKFLSYRLSSSALNKTLVNANTQKVEGFNRCLRRSLPKNITFSRNFHGRAHAAAFCVNNGEGKAITQLCDKVGCTIPKGGIVDHTLQKNEEYDKSRKLNMKSLEYKLKAKEKRRKLFKMYEEKKEKSDYEKNKLLKCPTRQTDKAKSDHTYHRKV